VFVGEPSVEDTVAILRGLKQRYEAHHKVTIADAALVSAAQLSNRYITGRQLPDKAIDLVDEAASRLRMEIDSAPVEIDELRRNVDRLKLEQMALKKEKDEASKQRLEKLEEDLGVKTEELDSEWRLTGLSEREISKRHPGCSMGRFRNLSSNLLQLKKPRLKTRRAITAWSVTRLARMRLPALLVPGPAFQPDACWRVRVRNF
jgi:ATP-dependent Clp protease ATP-binding subunit ClpA